MLILTRKSGEEIRIGDRISLKIIEIRGNQVRVGIDAPKDVAVHRKEIYALIQDHNRAAAKSAPLDPGLLSSIWADQKEERISIGS